MVNKRYPFLFLILCCQIIGCSSAPHAIKTYENILIDHQAELKDASFKGGQLAVQKILEKEVWDLADCFYLAQHYNEKLKIAGEDYYQTIIRRNLALSAILPKVEARASYYRQDGAAEFGSLQEKRDQRLVIEQSVFSGFREFKALKQSKQNMLSKEATLRYERARIFSWVSDAFYEVLKWESSFNTLDLMMEIQKERLSQVRERYQLGLVRKTEVLSIEIELADIEVQRRETEGKFEVSRIQLAVLIGNPVRHSLKDLLKREKVSDLKLLLNEAREKREDLKALEYSAGGIKEEVGIAKGKYLPVVTFLGNYYLHRDGPQEGIDWDISMNAELSIFDGGAIRTEVRDAQSRYRQALLILEGQKKGVEEEVSTAYFLYQSLQDQAKVNKKRVKLAEENYQLVQEEYRQGLASHIDVQLRYHDWVEARIKLDSVQWDRQSAYVKLLFLVGKLKLGESCISDTE